MTVIKCVKGHENPQGRPFCQVCGSRLLPAITTLVTQPPVESREAQDALAAARQENVKLKAQIDSLGAELHSFKDLRNKVQAVEGQAAALEPQLVALTEQRQAAEAAAAAAEARVALAETKAAAAASQLATKVKELEQRSWRGRRTLAIGGIVLASLGAFGGFGVSHYLPRSRGGLQIPPPPLAPSTPSDRPAAVLEQQAKELIKQQEEWGAKQQAEQKALTEQTDKLNAQVKAFDQQRADWSAKQALDLKERTRRTQELDGRERGIEAERARQASAERGRVAAAQSAPAAPANSLGPGTVVWRGQVDRPTTISIFKANGVFNSSLASAQVTGSLPGRPCALQDTTIGDDKVSVSAKPSAANGWSQIVFTVQRSRRADGWVTIMFVCEPTK